MEPNAAFTGSHSAGLPKETATSSGSTVVNLRPQDDQIPLANPAAHPEVASFNVQPGQARNPGRARIQYYDSLSAFFQHPPVVVAMARGAIPRDVLEQIAEKISSQPSSTPLEFSDVAQFVTEERERQVKAALMNALPKYLAYVNNELSLPALQSGSFLIHAQPADGKVEVFARRLQALLNLRDMTRLNSKSLMDDWCEYFLQHEEVQRLVSAEVMGDSKVMRRAAKDLSPAYARASMGTEFDGSKGDSSQAPRLAGGRFRRLWLLWMKHYECADSSLSVATELMLSFADVVQAHVAGGNPASDVFDSESLAFSFDRTESRLESSFIPLVKSLWNAMVVLQEEYLDETKAVFIEELRAALRRARTRKCCLWVSQSGIFGIILTMVGVGITVLDQVTDVILGVEHAMDGNPGWAFLTFFLACLPSALQGSLMLPNTIFGTCVKKCVSYHGKIWSVTGGAVGKAHSHRNCMVAWCAILSFLVLLALFPVLVTVPMGATVIGFLIAISPFLGMLFIMKWSWLYFRQPDTRTVLEANLRAYSIMETLLESVPQLLLQLYIYSIQGELQRLRLVDVAAVSLSLLAIFKTVLIGDMEIHRNTADSSVRVPPLLVVTSLFRLFDVVVGVACAVTVAVYLRQHLIWFFLASAVAQASPISLNFGVCSFCYLFRCGLCCVTCCAGRAKSPGLSIGRRRLRCVDIFLFPAMVLIFAFTPLIPLTLLSALALPFVFSFCCRVKNFSESSIKRFNWESANESALKQLVPFVEPIFSIPANWALSSGPSFMLLVRKRAVYDNDLSRPDVCRKSTIACQTGRSLGQGAAPQLFPVVFTRICTLISGFVISYLVNSGVLHTDLAGTPLSEGYKMLSFVSLYGALPLSVWLLFWAWLDVSRHGKSLVGRCTRTDLLGRMLECLMTCCARSGAKPNQISPV